MNPINIIKEPFEIRKLIMQLVNAEIIDFNPETLVYTFRNRGHVIAQRTDEELEFLYFWLNELGELRSKEQSQLLKVMEKRVALSSRKKWLFV